MMVRCRCLPSRLLGSCPHSMACRAAEHGLHLLLICVVAVPHAQVRHVRFLDVIAFRTAHPVVPVNPVHLDLDRTHRVEHISV